MTDTPGPIRFDGEVVVVTGAGRGIGRAHALLFAARGAHVVVNDLDGDVAEEVVGESVAAGGAAKVAVGHVVDDTRAIIDSALGVDGRLDALVNNAGVAHSSPFGENSAVDAERLLRVHAVGAAALTAAAWPALVASRGRVVNTTSNSVMGLVHHTAYAAAKGAVLGFTRSLAVESAAVGVRVNAIMPMARTRMYEQAGGVVGSEQDQIMSRCFPPELVSPTVVFLASADVPHNGQVIEVSGGTTAFVHFAVTPYLPATTPEAARDALGSPPGELTVVDRLEDMLAAKIAMVAAAP